MFPQAGGAEILRFGICRLCQSAPLFHCFTDNGSAHQHTYWCTQCYCTLVRTSHQPPIMHSSHFILSCALLSLDEVYDPSQFRPIKNLYAQIDKHQKVRLPLDWCDPGSWTCSSYSIVPMGMIKKWRKKISCHFPLPIAHRPVPITTKTMHFANLAHQLPILPTRPGAPEPISVPIRITEAKMWLVCKFMKSSGSRDCNVHSDPRDHIVQGCKGSN